ncbi:uncharacterized protein I303_104624 [Kwoniella dejecticola CBS 10117]|uniref:Myb-like domain-containing protein n=1 Tax=Kwoniella dejecticola CBS 10117 TaxID=1296121 RepID=A0A1A6A4V3_9TREE|nr:uncharacterized protein I303_04398 [Kwoniella dejecticola CBS 10117]OBR85068.1 hypothetical protein I303_04398 [Kwoniella dejecticola CBS 10117]
MSLRLPSQNKFRPTFKPGQKKAPPVRPPTKTPTSSQNVIATSSQPQADSSAQNVATSSSLPEALRLCQSAAARSSQEPNPSVSTAIQSTLSPASPNTDTSPSVQTVSQVSPSKGSSIAPTPIPSSQIRAIRSAISPTKALTDAPTSRSNDSTHVEHLAELDSTLQNTSPAPTGDGPGDSRPDHEISQKLHSNPPSRVETSPKKTFAVPPVPSNPAKLSLLDAARNHSSDMPSPGQIRRRTPSIASRSERAPSATPQPQRAPSIGPSHRASSITPQSRREPSATPQPPPSSSMPSSMPPPSSSRNGPTPSPRAQQSNLPPSLGTSAPSNGFPPSLGTSSSSVPSSSTAGPSFTREEAAALAAAAVESIEGPSGRGPKIRKGRARVTKGAVPLAKSKSNIPATNSQVKSNKARKPRAIRASTEDRRTSEEDDDDESDDSIDTATGEKRQYNGEDEDGRPVKRRKRVRAPGVATISLHDIQPEEMIGDNVDEVVITMGDLATTLAAQGRVSKRAIKIDEHKRAQELQKREDARVRAEKAWMRNQIKRQKVRHTKNRDRARRREELGKLGMDESVVSADEDDSEEEYEPEPERLTPESTPESDTRRDGSTRPDGLNGENRDEENEDDDEEYNDVPVNNDPLPAENDNQTGEDAEVEENQDDDVLMTAEAIAEQEERDADIAALRAMGIEINDDVPVAEGDGPDDDEGAEEYDWENTIEDSEYPDIEGYRREQERERRRMREMQERDDGEIVEIDDETRFINANSFAKYTKPQRWDLMETELFYQVLEETGENYTLMKAYFPGRTIRQLKMKGNRENRANPDKMTAAILARRPIDKEYLTKSAGYDPTKPWDKEEALFEEAKSDADKLRRMDSMRPEEGEGDGTAIDIAMNTEGVHEDGDGDDPFVGDVMEEEKDEDEHEDGMYAEDKEEENGDSFDLNAMQEPQEEAGEGEGE